MITTKDTASFADHGRAPKAEAYIIDLSNESELSIGYDFPRWSCAFDFDGREILWIEFNER